MAWKCSLSISHNTVRIGTCDFNPEDFHLSLSFQKESFDAMEERLALPTEFLKCLTRNTTQAFKFLKQRPGKESLICKSLSRVLEISNVSPGFVFKLASIRPYDSSFYQLGLCYDKETRLTYGLLLSTGYKYSPVVPRLLRGLEEQKTYCD